MASVERLMDLALIKFNRYRKELKDGRVLKNWTESAVRAKGKALTKTFNEYRQYYEQWMAELDEPDPLAVEGFDTVERYYETLTARIRAQLSQYPIKRTIKRTVRTSDASAAGMRALIKELRQERRSNLPTVVRIETPRAPEVGTFDGTPAKWPAFRDLFIAEIHNKELEPVVKLVYLQKACIEQAKEILGNWQTTNENYLEAWDHIQKKFGDIYHIKQGILNEIFKLEVLERESYRGLRHILDTTSSCLRQLKVMNVPVNYWDDIVINVTGQRLLR